MLDKGIDGKMWRVVKNLYQEVGSCVRLGEVKTDWFSLEVGLRQGCIISNSFLNLHRWASRGSEERDMGS